MATRKRNKNRAPTCLFRLYISDRSPRSVLAVNNLERLCQNDLEREYEVRIIDIHENPGIALSDNILAIPTLKRTIDGVEQTVIGTLADEQKLLAWMGLNNTTKRAATQPIVVQPIGQA